MKEKQATADVMFEPLQDVIDLLKDYGAVIPEESLVQLTELPEKWANTKRLSVTAKQQVSPLQVIKKSVLESVWDELKHAFFTGHGSGQAEEEDARL